MALKGDLASVELAQVFQMLALNHKIGLLSIGGPARDRALYFDQRGVTLRFSEHALMERVLASAVRTGRIAEDAVAQARSDAGGSAPSALQTLQTQELLTEADVAELCRGQIEEDIYEAFLWKDAHFEFLEGTADLPGREGRIDERFFFSPDFLIMEAARRLDEWESIREKIPNINELFEAIPDGVAAAGGELAAEHQAVLDAIDGFHTVGRIIQVTGCPSFQVHKSIMHLMDQGMVQAVAIEDLPSRAQDCLVQGRTEDALLLFEKSIEQGVDIPECHCAAALVYEEQNERSSACYHWRAYAEFLITANKKADAAETLLRVRGLLPTDLMARERLVEVAANLPAGALGEVDAIAEGKLLAEILVEMGENERARVVLERLLAGRTADLELKKCLAAVHSRAGDTRRVLELHESIADDLVQAGDPIGAVKYLQKILLFDKSRTDISERIRKLYVLDERRRVRRRGLMVALSAVLLLVLVGSCYGLYESHARTVYGAIPPQAEEFLHRSDYPAARTLYQDFLERFPLSLVGSRAQSEMRRIQELEREWQEQQEEVKRRQDLDRERLRDRYRNLWKSYQAAEKSGHSRDLIASLEMLDHIDEVVRSIGAEQDLAWAGDVRLGELRQSLREHMVKSESLAADVGRARQSGQMEAARKLVERLHAEFMLTPIARSTPVPVELQSHPPGAAVFVDGKPFQTAAGVQAVTPVVLDVPFQGQRKVRLEHAGHSPVECELTSSSPFHTSVSLFVLPAATVPLGKGNASMLAADNAVLVAAVQGNLVVTDLKTNAVRSRRSLPSLADLAVPPVLTGDRILCATADGILAAYPMLDGDAVWQRKIGRQVRGAMVEKDGYVYLGDDGGRVRCVAVEGGDVVWERDLQDPVLHRPALRAKNLLVATRNRLLCLRSDDGEPRWSMNLPAELSAPPVPLPEGFVLALADGTVGCWSDPSSAPRWTWQSLSPRGVDSLTVMGESLFLCTAAGRLQRLSLARGEAQATAELSGKLLRGPESRGDLLLLLLERRADDRLLLALAPEDFQLRWQFRTGVRVTAGPTPANGRVWLATEDGNLLCFK